MPELPEVETTCTGIRPFLLNQTIAQLIVRQHKLKQPVPADIVEKTRGKTITQVSRRAKYILLHLSEGCLLIHLGMSGHLRINSHTQAQKHDHIDLCLENNTVLRYHDPRRFGLWTYHENSPVQSHPLLVNLGPEPLSDAFHANYFYKKAMRRTKAIKSFIMDHHIIVGVGNIYATESLFLTNIHPLTPANRLSKRQCDLLCKTIKQVLRQAIAAGGTTLRDFYSANGTPGYFAITLNVYGKQGQACPQCATVIETITIGARRSTYCPCCQIRAY